jgi:hypothetical protein
MSRVICEDKHLRVEAVDKPGPGGASHEYTITEVIPQQEARSALEWYLSFQKGSIHEVGVNGVQNESLLAIVRDRLEMFQMGDFPCKENEYALSRVREALMWLGERTKDRVKRGVEGQNKP